MVGGQHNCRCRKTVESYVPMVHLVARNRVSVATLTRSRVSCDRCFCIFVPDFAAFAELSFLLTPTPRYK